MKKLPVLVKAHFMASYVTFVMLWIMLIGVEPNIGKGLYWLWFMIQGLFAPVSIFFLLWRTTKSALVGGTKGALDAMVLVWLTYIISGGVTFVVIKARKMRREALLSLGLNSGTYDTPFKFNSLSDKAVLVGATFVLPGLGHIFQGKYVRSMLWMCLTTAIIISTYGVAAFTTSYHWLAITISLLPITAILATVDVLRARHIGANHLKRIPAIVRWPIAVLMIVAAMFLPLLRLSGVTLTHLFAQGGTMANYAMLPTIDYGDQFTISHLLKPVRWNVIAYRVPFQKDWDVGRIIGMPGDTIEIRKRELFINGAAMSVPIAHDYQAKTVPWETLNASDGHPVKLGGEEYFVITDQPRRSGSRYWHEKIDGHQLGALPKSRIIGVATLIWSPFKHIKSIYFAE